MKLYTFFDTALEFSTNYPPAYKEFDRIYGYFGCHAALPSINCSIEKHNNSYHIRAKSKRYSLEYTTEKLHPDIYLSLFSPVIYEVKDYFLIHAGSLSAPSGKGIIISAPCGFGKTTLTRELLKKDFRLLSDELAPININTGLTYPYPRGMGILLERTKKIVDIPNDKIGNPCRPGFVIFLTLEKTPAEDTLEIALGRMDNDVVNSFRELKGIKEITLLHDRLFPMLRLLLEKDAHIAAKIQEMGIPIIYTQKGRTEAPDFNAEPRLCEILPKDGIFELSQNILNAHNSSLLEERFSGSNPRMIFELTGLMENARFFTLTVGRLKEMIRLICQL